MTKYAFYTALSYKNNNMACIIRLTTIFRKELYKIVMYSLWVQRSKSTHLVSYFTQMSDFLNRGEHTSATIFINEPGLKNIFLSNSSMSAV